MTNKEKTEVSLEEILEGMAEAAETILPIVEDQPKLIAEINRLKREVHELKYGKDQVFTFNTVDLGKGNAGKDLISTNEQGKGQQTVEKDGIKIVSN